MISRLTGALVVVNACAVGALLLALWFVLHETDVPISHQAVDTPNDVGLDHTSVAPVATALEQTLLFSAARVRIPPPPADSAASVPPPLPRLVGIVGGGGHRRFALLENDAATQRSLVAPGDTFGVWVVSSISAGAVHLRLRSNPGSQTSIPADAVVHLRSNILSPAISTNE